MYTIYRLEGDEADTRTLVETFEELPAPAVTLGGRLLALKNDTGFDHIAVPVA